MAIERKTPIVGLDILEVGAKQWGLFLNANFDLLDAAVSADRSRLTALETISAVLPLAIANRVAHNLLRNNVFSQGTVSAPEVPTFWTSQFLNGAVGTASRTNQTFLVGSHSLRLSIASVDTSPAAQTRPYPGLNVLDPETQAPIATTDPKQLTNGFGYAFQTANLSAKTIYTLSAYGKAEIPNPTLGINVHWKVGIVFKTTGGSIIHSHFTSPQVNRTNNIATDSFERVELTFTTPDLPVVSAEIWLIAEGSIPAGIGSVWLDGIQLEQATKATSLDMFAMQDGDLIVDGDLILSGDLTLQQENLIFDSDNVTFTGNVQLGDNTAEDSLEVFTKSSIFHGPLTIEGNTTLGDDAIDDLLDVVVNKTTFFNNQNPSNPQGGDVCIQGDLTVDGDTTLGSDVTEDTVTINAALVTAGSSLSVVDDLDVGGFLDVKRGVILGSNDPTPSPFDTLTVKMQDGGSCFFGDVTLKDALIVDGDVTLGDSVTDIVTVNAGATTLNGSLQVTNALLVEGPTTFNIGSGSGDNFSITANDFALTATGTADITTSLLALSGDLTLAGGNTASITSSNVNFATSGSPLTTFDIFSAATTMSGTLDVTGNFSTDGNIAAASGTDFLFGSAFSANSSGVITIGDPIDLTGSTYNNNLTVYAGTTVFGDYGTQKKGNVHIGGDLFAAGDITLGSSTSEDTLNFTGSSINFEVGSGDVEFGGGFRNETYNPSSTDHGGISIDNHGNLAMDGKLTVKGPFDPTNIIITPLQSDNTNVVDAIVVTSPISSPTTTFRLTSEGTINAAEALVLGGGVIAEINDTTTNFGVSGTPLQAFSVYADTINLDSTSALILNTNVTMEELIADNTTINGDLSVIGSATISGSISSPGSSFAFGAAPGTPTTFNVLANTILLGIDGSGVGNVTVGNNLSVRNDLNVGFPTQYDNTINLNAADINVDISSNRPGGLELAGFRVGGGFQDNVFNAAVLDHGGVTIDAYGNIYADGSIFQKGDLGFESLTLTVPVGGIPNNPVLTVINNSAALGEVNLRIDGYGNIISDGYVQADSINVDGYICLNGSDVSEAPDGTGLGTTTGSKVVFKVSGIDLNVTYSEYSYGEVTYGSSESSIVEIDNVGNFRTAGYIHTDNPGKSNISAYSITVGDGYESFGDLNTTGPVGANSDPINAAIAVLVLAGQIGTVFIKKGTYQLPTTGIILPDGISLKGEGEATILDGYDNLTTTGIECGIGSHVEDLLVTNCTTAVSIPTGVTRAMLHHTTITDSTTGVDLDGDENIVSMNIIKVSGTAIDDSGSGNLSAGLNIT